MPRSLLKLSLLLLLLPVAAEARPAGKGRVVVMEIKSVQGVSEGTATILTDIVVDEVAQLGVFEVVGSREIAALIGLERQRQLLGCDDTSCLSEIGGALGADYLLNGQVGKIGSRYHLSLTLSSTSKARAVARESRFCEPNDDALVAAAQEAVRAAFANLGVKSPEPAAQHGSPSSGGTARVSGGSQPPAASSAVSAASESNPVAPGPAAVGQAAPSRVLPWTVFGGGLAVLAGGGAAAFLTRRDYAALESEVGGLTREQFDERASAVKTRALAADLLVGAGVLTSGIGLWLLLGSSDEQPAVLPTAGAGSIGFVSCGRF